MEEKDLSGAGSLRIIQQMIGAARDEHHEKGDGTQVGFYLSLIVIVVSGYFKADSSFIFGYYYMLYAFWMYIHGSALRFKPLIIGAYINWAAAILIFAIEPFRYDMIISSVAVLLGYLVPGYMLKEAYRKRLLVK